MYIKSRILSVLFRIIFIIVCGAGIVMKVMEGGMTLNTVLGDFALVAGVLAVIYFIYLIVTGAGHERGALRGAVTIYMILVFTVYYFIYFGISADPSGLSAAGYLLYFVSPLMAVLDYLLFCRKGSFGAYGPIIWALIPVIFDIAVILANRAGVYMKSISYFSLPGANMIVSLLVFLGIGYLLFVADGMMAGRRR